MNYVHFGTSLKARAPDMFGCICTEPEARWVSLEDIVKALQSGEPVFIRQASEAELKRAEALLALRSITEEMNGRIRQLLDQCDTAVVNGAITRARDAVESTLEQRPLNIPMLDSTL